MKLGAIALMFVLPMTMIDGPPTERRATTKDYREILQMLRGIQDTLDDLDDAVSKDGPDDCRGLSPEKTVRCGAEAFHPPGGVEQALACWTAESGWGTEAEPMGHSFHGPMQYLPSTYISQQESMPDVVEWYELSPAVHDMRSNILTAIAWAARNNSWSPWTGCP